MFTQKAKLILALYKSDREIISVYSARTARLLCISRRLGSNGTHGGLCVLVGQSLISALTGDAFSFLFPLLSCLWHYVHEVHLSLVIPQLCSILHFKMFAQSKPSAGLWIMLVLFLLVQLTNLLQPVCFSTGMRAFAESHHCITV